MKNSELREMTTGDIIERLEENEELYVKMKLNHAISPLDNPMSIKGNRREIARIKTELRSRELSESKNKD